MKKIFTKEFLLLAFIIGLFILLRSVYFTDHLNFSADQAEQSADVLQYYRDHKVPLIGNPINSTVYEGHYMYQGPGYYYMLFPFLLLTNFDPINSSYLFMLFCALMVIPLYFGMKMLVNARAATIMVLIYALAPYYLNYTRFHWNPNYQLALLPLLILLMGLYKKNKSPWIFFLMSALLGFLFQFHYQFILIILGVGIYYFVIKRVSPKLLLHFFGGLIIGVAPLLVFELRHEFYNINTLILLLTNYDKVTKAGSITTPHYYISLSFIAIVCLLGLLQNRIPKKRQFLILSAVLAAGLFTWSAVLNFQKPQTAFWSYAPNWKYENTAKVYEIIKESKLENYNVADLSYYNTKASTVKYLMKRDNVNIQYEEYYTNKYLFVIKASNTELFDTMSYEVAFFKPSKLLNTWELNEHYNLYLLERQ
jgi:hypothetical protein